MNDNSHQALLVLNAGSSNIKFSLYSTATSSPESLGSGSVEVRENTATLVFHCTASEAEHQQQWPCADNSLDGGTLSNLMGWLEHNTEWSIAAAAHRVVHGGNRREIAARVDAQLISEMEALISMAPLHQPLCLAPMTYLARELPGLPQVACFDTAFHHTLDQLETLYGLPRALTEQGVRRYGFHGLSYEYIASVLPQYDQRAAHGRTIVAHLGNGASLCAMHNRISRGTTMGFSTLDGLLMGTRPGHLDPGILIYLLHERGMSLQTLEHLLYHECGLLGVSGGIASDMRVLMASRSPHARDAIALFVRSVVKEIGTLAAVLSGVDALVFTGGIGEHADEIRNAILDGCGWLGVQRATGLSQDPNRVQPARLTLPGSGVSAWAIATDENTVIARHSLRLLNGL